MSRRGAREPLPIPALVFTDLDGTLLDHTSYGYDAAAEALAALARSGVPLVLCSSKCAAEMLPLQRELGLTAPVIPENGAAVLAAPDSALGELFPERFRGWAAKLFGTPYPALRRAFDALRERVPGRLEGFGDVDVATVAHWTGLENDRAALAKQRDFDEPFLWHPEPTAEQRRQAEAWLATQGLVLTRGGRFWHLMGANDKGRAVTWLLQALAEVTTGSLRSLALGDSENDLPMLRAADDGVLVARPDGSHLAPRPQGIHAVAGIGPQGWNRAVLDWLAGGFRYPSTGGGDRL